MSKNVDPVFYRRVNKLQRHDAKKIIREFGEIFQLRSDGEDSLMDVGCGTGDVLMDFIAPILPKTYSKIVGTDISPRMIRYSEKAYADHDRVEFNVLDIETEKMPLEYYDQFDHVTSFFSINWVHNQRQALTNIYDMLHQGGDCLLVLVVTTPGFDAFPILAANPRWSEYLKDFEGFVPPLQKHPNPLSEYTKLLKEIGFANYSVEIRHKPFVYEGYESFKNHVVSVTPFVDRIPIEEQEEFKKEMCEKWIDLCLCEELLDGKDYRYTYPYTLAILTARK